MTHSGRATNRRTAGGKQFAVLAPAVHDDLNAKLAGVTLSDFDGAAPQPPSWGRSPIATWRIAVTGKLDLSTLTEVQFAVQYAFRGASAVSVAAPAQPGSGATVDLTADVPAAATT